MSESDFFGSLVEHVIEKQWTCVDRCDNGLQQGFSRGRGKGRVCSYFFSKSCFGIVNNHVDKDYLIRAMPLGFLKIIKNFDYQGL